MESFWGVEVKPGQALTCESLKNDVIHLTQVALGEINLLSERVSVYVCVDNKMTVLGTLTYGRCHQIGLNLIFNKTFQISHSSKYASLFFSGYSRIVPEWKQSVKRDGDSDDDEDSEDFRGSDDESENDEDEDDDEGTPKDLDTKTQRIVKGKVSTSEDDSNDDEEGEDDEDEDMEDVSRSDDKDEESEDEVDSSEDDEDEEHKGVCMMHAGNKRPVLTSGIKTPKTNKKAKVVTPQGQKPGEGKKYVQFATHYDSANKGAKKGKKTPGGSKQQSLASEKTPKSSGTPWPGKKGHSVAKRAKGYYWCRCFP